MPPPPQFLRSGKNQCDIGAKHKKFGKIMKCPEKIYVCLDKIFFLVCTKTFFGMAGKIVLVPPPLFGQIILCPPQTRLGPYAHVQKTAQTSNTIVY